MGSQKNPSLNEDVVFLVRRSLSWPFAYISNLLMSEIQWDFLPNQPTPEVSGFVLPCLAVVYGKACSNGAWPDDMSKMSKRKYVLLGFRKAYSTLQMQYSVCNPVGGYLHKPFERNALLTPRRQCEAMVTAWVILTLLCTEPTQSTGCHVGLFKKCWSYLWAAQLFGRNWQASRNS